MRDLLRADPIAGELFRYVYVCSYSTEREPLPSDEDFADCALLCEQIDWKAFPHRDRLPANCPTILFPSLDSLLLWPFNCINPYNVPELPTFPNGRFICGDRIILREVDKGRSAEDIHDYYLNGWDDYKVNIKRVRELERIRIEKRDARCDVQAGDLVLDKLGREPLFWNIGHPRRPLLATLMSRVLERCAEIEPALARIDAHRLEADHPGVGKGLSEVAVPIHPAIADELELEWYRTDTIYQQYGGLAFSYSAYFDQLIRYSIGNKQKLAHGEATATESAWQIPLSGPAAPADAAGYFPDGFMGKELIFRITAERPIRGLTIHGFCPSHHTGALELRGSVDDIGWKRHRGFDPLAA